MAQWILKDTMVITTSHTTRPLTEDEYRDLTLIKERDNFMEKFRSYHGNKMKVGDSTILKVETVSEDDNDANKTNTLNSQTYLKTRQQCHNRMLLMIKVILLPDRII